MTTYQGYTNYETWSANLWLDNDEGCYRTVRDLALAERDVYELADAIEMHADAVFIPDLPAGLASDLLTVAVQAVNWREIATAWLDSTRSEYNDTQLPEDQESDE